MADLTVEFKEIVREPGVADLVLAARGKFAKAIQAERQSTLAVEAAHMAEKNGDTEAAEAKFAEAVTLEATANARLDEAIEAERVHNATA